MRWHILSLTLISICLLGCERDKRLTPLGKLDYANTPERINVLIKEYCATTGYSYKDLMVSNFSVKVKNARLLLDSDKDGIADETEIPEKNRLGILPTLSDSNGDMFSDLLIYLAGIDITQQQRLKCADTNILDNDGDGIFFNGQYVGLNNCDENRVSLTDPNDFDTDGDTIPDYLELRFGLNPKDSNDALLDPDGDGLRNLEEVKTGTPIDEANLPDAVRKFEQHYNMELDVAGGKGCYKIEVSQIPVLNGGDDNLIALYLLEIDGNQNIHLNTDWLLVGPNSNGKTYETVQPNWPANTGWRIQP